jgi:VanZ family protein
MKKTAQLRLCTALIIVNLALIWGNSALPGETSGAMSGWVMELLSFLPDSELAHTLLRKIAHFSEFACLGLLIGWNRYLRRGKAGLGLTGLGLAAACIDETVQIFTPGRASSLMDVWIDTAGFATGLMLLILGYTTVKHKTNLEEQQP